MYNCKTASPFLSNLNFTLLENWQVNIHYATTNLFKSSNAWFKNEDLINWKKTELYKLSEKETKLYK